jgi:2'-5' RNA ligase
MALQGDGVGSWTGYPRRRIRDIPSMDVSVIVRTCCNARMADRTRTTASGGGVALRLFAALPVPSAHTSTLADLGEALAERATGAVAVPAEKLHVTFAFLGDVAEEYVPAVARALDDAAFTVPGPTSCTLGEPAVLGNGRALTVDVSLDLHAVLDCARDSFVDAVQAYAPSADRRPWRPHVTLLRTRTEQSMSRAIDGLRDLVPNATWVSPELRLYASLPGPTGHLHKVLHAVPFGTPVPRQ